MIENFLLEKLCCTKCAGSLENFDSYLQCSKCSAKFRVKDGIVIFYDEE